MELPELSEPGPVEVIRPGSTPSEPEGRQIHDADPAPTDGDNDRVLFLASHDRTLARLELMVETLYKRMLGKGMSPSLAIFARANSIFLT